MHVLSQQQLLPPLGGAFASGSGGQQQRRPAAAAAATTSSASSRRRVLGTVVVAAKATSRSNSRGSSSRRERDGGGGPPRRPRPSSGGDAPPPRQPLVRDDAAVPEVGWMWAPPAEANGDGSGGGLSGQAATTRRALRAANLRAKKSLGQNFCTDDAVLADIVAAARVSPGEPVIEVGPGTGNLTRHLLAANARVLAVEKDDALVERLRGEFAAAANLELVHGDVMRLDLPALVDRLAAEAAAAAAAGAGGESSGGDDDGGEQEAGPSSSGSTAATTAATATTQRPRVKVVANLPYNITKEFLLALLPRGDVVSELSIMIQEEVAQRLVDATPSRPDYRAMSVLTHFYSRPRYRFLIPKEKYFPVPGVDGALVTFKLRPPGKRPPVPDERAFVSLVSKAFSERRKMLRNTLQPLYSPREVEQALEGVGARIDARAQDLDFKQFAALHAGLVRQRRRQAKEQQEAAAAALSGGGGES